MKVWKSLYQKDYGVDWQKQYLGWSKMISPTNTKNTGSNYMGATVEQVEHTITFTQWIH